MFVAIVITGLYFKYIRKKGLSSRVYVSPGNRMDKYMISEDPNSMNKNIFGETVDSNIFGVELSSMDEIPSGIEPDITDENAFGIEQNAMDNFDFTEGQEP